MDAERFGRALGRGVRATAIALVEAADAAAAPAKEPNRATASPAEAARSTHTPTQGRPRNTMPVAPQVSRRGPANGGTRKPARELGRSLWAPAARAGGVLWLELTGSFFALFALAAAVDLWRHRGELTKAGDNRVWFAVAMLLAFGWFSVSSFMRARRRARC